MTVETLQLPTTDWALARHDHSDGKWDFRWENISSSRLVFKFRISVSLISQQCFSVKVQYQQKYRPCIPMNPISVELRAIFDEGGLLVEVEVMQGRLVMNSDIK